jgi:hypothetical protein
MEVFDRSLTHIPIEMHTKYLSNFHIKYISNSDQFVSSGKDLIIYCTPKKGCMKNLNICGGKNVPL